VPVSSATGTEQLWHARAITYVAATGKVRHVWNLQPDTWCFSATTDGRIAVISADRNRKEGRAHTFLFDTEKGRTEDIPSSWFDADERDLTRRFPETDYSFRLLQSRVRVTALWL